MTITTNCIMRLRALYLGQKVFMLPKWELMEDASPMPLDLGNIDSDLLIEPGYLLLRDLKSITDEERQHVFNIEFLHRYERASAIIGFDRIDLSDGQWFRTTNITHQYLTQRGFLLPFYDAETNQTITPAQFIEAGVVKIKE